jgi:hypothetical protein
VKLEPTIGNRPLVKELWFALLPGSLHCTALIRKWSSGVARPLSSRCKMGNGMRTVSAAGIIETRRLL